MRAWLETLQSELLTADEEMDYQRIAILCDDLIDDDTGDTDPMAATLASILQRMIMRRA